jgi:hypothetical protein
VGWAGEGGSCGDGEGVEKIEGGGGEWRVVRQGWRGGGGWYHG